MVGVTFFMGEEVSIAFFKRESAKLSMGEAKLWKATLNLLHPKTLLNIIFIIGKRYVFFISVNLFFFITFVFT